MTSAYSSYSACRQYLDDIDRAVAAVGPGAPRIDKIRPYFNHPGFIEPFAASVEAALAGLPAGAQARRPPGLHRAQRPGGHGRRKRQPVRGHGGPRCVGGRYAAELGEASRLIAQRVRGWLAPLRPGLPEPQRPAERALAGTGRERPPGGAGQGDARNGGRSDGPPSAVVVVPVGLRQRPHGGRARPGRGGRADRGASLGLPFARAKAPGPTPRFAEMVRELVAERVSGAEPLALGSFGPGPSSRSGGLSRRLLPLRRGAPREPGPS